MQVSGATISEVLLERLRAIRSASRTVVGDGPTPESIIQPILRLAVSVLKEQLGGRHYEISIWTTPSEPKILAYYDSLNNARPKTDRQRNANPQFYRENNYEVIRLLDHPDNEMVIKTRLSNSGYIYTDADQKDRIKSTVLYCFDVTRPAAIVLTSDAPDTFQGSRENIATEMVKYLSLAILGDLELLEPISAQQLVNEASGFAYSWIHLSDIHFGAGSQHHQFDQKLVGEALVRDLAQLPGGVVNTIFITGDVAFKGARNEYGLAAAWIRELAKAAGVDADEIRLVPGNHDVQRNIESDEWHKLVATVRANPTTLEDEVSKAMDPLLARLTNYSEFVREISPKHPRSTWIGDWAENRVCTSGERRIKIRVAGLSTVWVSDANDGRGEDGSADFTPNMTLSIFQLDLLRGGPAPPDLTLVLTHHPPEWLFSSCRQGLQRVLDGCEHLHLCGHIHKIDANKDQRFGRRGAAFRFTAGAAHDEETPLDMYAGEHCYAWGAIRTSPRGGWELGWAPRVYVPYLGSFRPDRTRYDLDLDGFDWATLRGPAIP